jgi:putative transposase
VSTHEEYLRLGEEDGLGRAAYRELFKAHVDAQAVTQIREATNGNFALGSTRFAKDIERALGRRARPGKAGRPLRDEAAGADHMDLL